MRSQGCWSFFGAIYRLKSAKVGLEVWFWTRLHRLIERLFSAAHARITASRYFTARSNSPAAP